MFSTEIRQINQLSDQPLYIHMHIGKHHAHRLDGFDERGHGCLEHHGTKRPPRDNNERRELQDRTDMVALEVLPQKNGAQGENHSEY